MLRNLGAPEIILIVVVLVLLFGSKRLPDATRSLGRSLRIFKSEIREMKNDNNDDDEATRTTTVVTERRPIEGRVEPVTKPTVRDVHRNDV